MPSRRRRPNNAPGKQNDAAVCDNGTETWSTLHKELKKTKFCLYQHRGICRFGDSCAFAHTLEEMQPAPNFSKTQLCKAYAEGGCHNPHCPYAHGEDELRSTGIFHKRKLCSWNEKGLCRNGDSCRFAHGLAELQNAKASEANEAPCNDETRNKIESSTGYSAAMRSPCTVQQAAEWQQTPYVGAHGNVQHLFNSVVFFT